MSIQGLAEIVRVIFPDFSIMDSPACQRCLSPFVDESLMRRHRVDAALDDLLDLADELVQITLAHSIDDGMIFSRHDALAEQLVGVAI
ncbi:MAG: hypothetical protein JSS16_15695 [Proteobacteria bacterium]|nr:hypothetical protein [Pseudomonadota bacterium]